MKTKNNEKLLLQEQQKIMDKKAVTQTNRQAKEWESLFINYTLYRRSISKVYKEF